MGTTRLRTATLLLPPVVLDTIRSSIYSVSGVHDSFSSRCWGHEMVCCLSPNFV
ncbi:hypothetical protein PF005_g29992 [Phytophthora fragariae]|uniref:Uncharacterized protein n=1 Tax=Phytophthora fragariae TaxID=53985 RepID=A0A6A3DD79_9STRA|nr:hypothetical protein PF003_g18564 [Phytophthora fragariae]KAE8897456.1 hypothetical protein PF003_g18568 [Phytophthora fragariae]KAE8919359.1 hypothetical protein PF009_g30333 [Phytophthora fragariae]KAE9062821.1 hypothetical protein PF007_g29771 [Phytophthora fragariae]KAE9068723.1 hypothetical protein PF006_g29732 [Phytophthora fragariae]